MEREQHLTPGPPPHANLLVLHAAPTLLVAEPNITPPPWKEREIRLPDTTFTMHLGHRQEWLRLNKVEPRLTDGVRVNL
jgi:hypothetical protein